MPDLHLQTAPSNSFRTEVFAGQSPESLRVRQQIEELRQKWDLLSEKLSKLEYARILETKTDEKMRLEQQIAEFTAERQQIGQQLIDLEAKLSSSQ